MGREGSRKLLYIEKKITEKWDLMFQFLRNLLFYNRFIFQIFFYICSEYPSNLVI